MSDDSQNPDNTSQPGSNDLVAAVPAQTLSTLPGSIIKPKKQTETTNDTTEATTTMIPDEDFPDTSSNPTTADDTVIGDPAVDSQTPTPSNDTSQETDSRPNGSFTTAQINTQLPQPAAPVEPVAPVTPTPVVNESPAAELGATTASPQITGLDGTPVVNLQSEPSQAPGNTYDIDHGDGITNVIHKVTGVDGKEAYRIYKELEPEFSKMAGTYTMTNGEVGISQPGSLAIPNELHSKIIHAAKISTATSSAETLSQTPAQASPIAAGSANVNMQESSDQINTDINGIPSFDNTISPITDSNPNNF